MSPGDSVSRVSELEVLRDRLIAASEVAGPRELPGVSRELRLILAELAELEGSSGGSVGDELEQQRARRVAGSEAAGS